MKTKSKIKNRIKKLSKQLDKHVSMKHRAILDDRRYHAQMVEEDIRHIEGQIDGLKWSMKK